MQSEELAVKILDKLDWEYDLVVNPGHYKTTKDLYAGDLILAILSTKNTPEAAEYCKVSYKVVQTAISRFLSPVFGHINGGGETWKFKLLAELHLRTCSSCKVLKPFDDYHKDSGNPDGIGHACKECRKIANAVCYKKESTKQVHQKSYAKNRDKIKARNAAYRAAKNLRIPVWANKAEIAAVYKNCPEDFHVDHIIPMKGLLVSGLHVVENLQYLPAEDNIRKSNCFDIEKFNSGELWYVTRSPPLISKKNSTGCTKRNNGTLSSIPCLYCNTVFKPHKYEQSYCSKACAGKHLNKTTESKEGYTKEYIESIIWNMPFTKGGSLVGLSDNGLRKMALRLGCLMPPSHFHVKTEQFKIKLRKENNIKELSSSGEIG